VVRWPQRPAASTTLSVPQPCRWLNPRLVAEREWAHLWSLMLCPNGQPSIYMTSVNSCAIIFMSLGEDHPPLLIRAPVV
jgi:hypothetical protein